MTALQAGYRVRELEGARTRLPPIAAATVCWQGGMVALSGAGANAVAVPAAANAALRVIGVAASIADNRLGVAGAMTVETRTGVFAMNNSASDPVTVGDIGAPCYVADDNTVSHSNGANTQPAAGTVFDIDPSGQVWVKFS
jgi:hypothetical protein